jgi:hypothetical protein
MRRLAITAGLVAMILAVFGCDGGEGEGEPANGQGSPTPAATATATVAPTQTPAATATVSPEDEVVTAYLHYWDAYSQALLDLNPALVEGVAAGEELQRIQEEIDGLRSQGLALRVDVSHNFVLLDVTSDSATLYDEITNNSFYVDAETKEPAQGSGSGEILKDTFYFQKIGGDWKVVRSTRQR